MFFLCSKEFGWFVPTAITFIHTYLPTIPESVLITGNLTHPAEILQTKN